MRVVYLFSNKGAAPSKVKSWKVDQESTNPGATWGIVTEGFFWLWKRLVEEKIVDEVLIVFESSRGPGKVEYFKNFSSIVIPNIDNVSPFLRDDDIFFVRGGFKSWVPLIKQASLRNWILFYQAATSSGKWLFWDLVFNDLIGSSYLDKYGRYQLAFRKPTHPEIFYPQEVEKEYDLCLGSSHIHDGKGQWKGLEICKKYQKFFGIKLKCIMPGMYTAGNKSRTISSTIQEFKLDVNLSGFISRKELASALNRTKLFLHLGTMGQNDRGPLESLACGTPVILSNPKSHSPSLVTALKNEVSVFKNVDDPGLCARHIHNILKHSPLKSDVLEFYKKTHDFETVILPQMDKVFSFFRQHPNKDRKELWEYLNGMV